MRVEGKVWARGHRLDGKVFTSSSDVLLVPVVRKVSAWRLAFEPSPIEAAPEVERFEAMRMEGYGVTWFVWVTEEHARRVRESW